MYKSPIEMIEEQMTMQINMDIENGIFKAVQRYNIDVDKEELLKALKYDREQYDKGYQDGLDADKWIPCSERLPEKPAFGEKGYIVQSAYVWEPYSAYWDGEKWTDKMDDVIDDVIAWMELPQRYKGE